MTTKTIAANLITEQAKQVLSCCQSLRNLHDKAKSLIADQQLGLDFEPQRNNVFQMPVALFICNITEAIRKEFDQDAIRSFADSYKAGDYVEPITVAAENGAMRVVAGFTRYAGLMLANAEGANVKRVWVTEVKGGRADELIRQCVSNQQVQVDPLDLGEAYRELLEDHGLSVEMIATSVHRKVDHVRKMLDLVRVPVEVKQMVSKGQVSVTRALAEVRQCKVTGQDTVSHMQGQLAEAQRNGSNRITQRAVSAPATLYGRKDLDATAPLLVELADQMERAMPFMGSAPKTIKLELTLSAENLNLEEVSKALANLRAAVMNANAAQVGLRQAV